VNSKICIETCR